MGGVRWDMNLLLIHRHMSQQASVVSVGIDVAKAKLDVAMLRDNRDTVFLTVPNNSIGIGELVVFLRQQRTAETVPCVMESTGNLHLVPACSLTQEKFTVKVINPLITKRYQRASIRNAKNDRIDAERLATIGNIEKDLPVFSANKSAIVSRKLISYLGHLEETRQKLLSSSKQLSETLQALGIKERTTQCGAKITLKAIDRQIDSLRKRIIALAPPEAKELSDNVPGLSETQASVLLGSLSDKQFFSKNQLVAFVGLDIMVRKSGTFQGKEKLSKRGNSYLRKILYQTAWSLKQHNPTFKAYYNRLYREQGKHYTASLIAVARKFLKFLFAYYWKHAITFPQPTA